MPKYSKLKVLEMAKAGKKHREIADALGITIKQVEYTLYASDVAISRPRLPASPYPQYNDPLRFTGDALILNDLEVPFHHSDFANRCLDLAHEWGIANLLLGGDVMHFETFSAWGAAWAEEKPAIDQISEERAKQLRAIADKLTGDAKAELLAQVDELTANRGPQGDEIKAGAKTLQILAQLFDDIYYVIGNHDDRFLRKLDAPTTPQKLLDFLSLTAPCWHIKPYYKAIFTSGGEEWHVEHQNGAAANVAVRIANKNDAHTICAHNHVQAVNWSDNGKYFAISSGHACDELRMPYASQRSNSKARHNMGAVIVRDGVPWVLNERVDWKRMMMCK